MCTALRYKFEIVTKSFIAYKKVRRHPRKGWYQSHLPPTQRGTQTGFSSNGTVLIYKTNKVTHSPMPETPGVYLYTTVPANVTVVKVRVPKGAIVRWGIPYGNKLVANKIVVLGLVK